MTRPPRPVDTSGRLNVAESVPILLPTVRDHPLDPAPELKRLREQQPLCRMRYSDGHIGWLVTGYAYGRALLADRRFSMRPTRTQVGDPVNLDAVQNAFGEAVVSGDLLATDPPQHERLRRAVAGQFTPRRVNEGRALLERIVADRLDAMEQAGPPVDLVVAFAQPIPSLSICELFGVPQSDRSMFEEPTAILFDPESTAEEVGAAAREFLNYIRGVIQHKRLQPASDLLSELVGGGELDDDEVAGMALQLFEAGHDTTANMLSLGTLALLRDRSCWEALRADPSLIDTAVEELLRYLTIIQLGTTTRTALEDVELGGVLIKAGESVTVSLSAANRDPERFPDPDVLDLSRGAKDHLAFGRGIHMCLGQHLARLELQLGFAGLIQRFPTLHLTVPVEEVPLYSGNRSVYGVRQLPVAW